MYEHLRTSPKVHEHLQRSPKISEILRRSSNNFEDLHTSTKPFNYACEYIASVTGTFLVMIVEIGDGEGNDGAGPEMS
jgi:hypothetical protein